MLMSLLSKKLYRFKLKINIKVVRALFFYFKIKKHLKKIVNEVSKNIIPLPRINRFKFIRYIKLILLCSFLVIFISLFPSPYTFFQEAKPFYGDFSWNSVNLVRLSQGDFINNAKGGLENYIPRLRLIEYSIEKGDTLWRISKKLNVDPDSIISCNSFSNVHSIHEGDKILVPNMRGIFVKVREGDTIFDFSSKYKISSDLIIELNDLKTNTLIHGMKIFLPEVRFSNIQRAYALGEAFDKPIRGRLTSGFGFRRDPFTRRRSFHSGIDIAARIGTCVHASQAGKVVFTRIRYGYGKTIIIEHKFGYRTLYGHLSYISVSRGQNVKKGQIIGLVGNSGRSTGPHLHFEIWLKNRIINPLTQTNMAVR